MADEPGRLIAWQGYYGLEMRRVWPIPDMEGFEGFAAFCSCGTGLIVGQRAKSGHEEQDWGDDHPAPSHQRLTCDEYLARFPKRAMVQGVVSDA